MQDIAHEGFASPMGSFGSVADGEARSTSDVKARPEHEFRYIRRLSYLDSLPPQAYLINRILPRGGYIGLVGAYGQYKSFVMLDMCCSIAAGIPYQGHETEQGAVVIIE